MDFAGFRACILFIETVEPNTLNATHPSWDQRVRDAGYQFVFSHVLNRCYMRSSLVLDMIRQPARNAG